MASSAGNRRGPPGSTEGTTLVPGSKSKMRNPNKSLGDGGPDPSVLRPSIAVSVTGVKQTLQALENGTQEVRDYLLDECHVIYECRTCLNMFRSVANFIAHKRSYCTAKLKNVRHVYRRDPPEELDLEAESTTAFVEPEPVETVIPNQEWDLRDYSPSLELLREAGLIKELETRPLVTSLKKEKSLSNIIGKLRWKAQGGLEGDFYRSREREATTYLMEPMRQTTQAVFQTPSYASTTMGSRYVELERLKNKPSVFIGPDGKIVDPGDPPPRLAFGSSASQHGPTCFPCPLCNKRTFVTSKGVLRHAMRFHGKDLEGAKAVRRQSKKMAFVKHNNVKKPYDPMCFGCGKKFESHQGISIHQGYCYRYKNRAFAITSERAIALMKRQPEVRIRRLDNQAVRAALAKWSSKDEAQKHNVLFDSVSASSTKNNPTEANSKAYLSNGSTIYDDSDEKMSGSSGIGSNEENDCNVENIAAEINKPGKNARKPIVHLPRIRSRAETPQSSRSSSPAPTKKRKWNGEESCRITLNKTGLSETSLEGTTQKSSPSTNSSKDTQAMADGDDDEISFKISPDLGENFTNRQVVPRLKRARIEGEEEEEESATDVNGKKKESPKRTQRSIFQWVKKTPAVPSPEASTSNRISNSSRGSTESNGSDVDFGPKLSVSDSFSATKRRGAKSTLGPASGSETDAAVGRATVAVVATVKRGRGRPKHCIPDSI